MSAVEHLPVRFYPELLLDERIQVAQPETLEFELDPARRGTFFVLVEGCGVETRIRFRYLSGRVYQPANYYKMGALEARRYVLGLVGDALRSIVLSVNPAGGSEARLRVWRATASYDVRSVPEGVYDLDAYAEPLEPVEMEVELPSDPEDVYRIVYEYLPGVLRGVEGAYPWTASSVEVTLVDTDEPAVFMVPVYPQDIRITPCTAKWSSTIIASVIQLTLNPGQVWTRPLSDTSFWFMAWYSGGTGGKLRIVERRLRPYAALRRTA